MDWNQFFGWGFQAMIAGGVGYAAYCMGQVKVSIEELNKQMAIIIERDVWHTKWLERHDAEIKDIKNNKWGN